MKPCIFSRSEFAPWIFAAFQRAKYENLSAEAFAPACAWRGLGNTPEAAFNDMRRCALAIEIALLPTDIQRRLNG